MIKLGVCNCKKVCFHNGEACGTWVWVKRGIGEGWVTGYFMMHVGIAITPGLPLWQQKQPSPLYLYHFDVIYNLRKNPILYLWINMKIRLKKLTARKKSTQVNSGADINDRHQVCRHAVNKEMLNQISLLITILLQNVHNMIMHSYFDA